MLTRFLIFIFAVLIVMTGFLNTAQAFSQAHSCTKDHLNRAITINQNRRPLYARLSNNQSLEVTDAMISMEKDLLKKAPLADWGTFIYQLAGVPLLCKEYVSMDLVPAFQPRSPRPWPLLENFKILNIEKLTADLQDSNNKKDFSAVLRTSEEWLDLLQTQPQFHCLTRHFLESIARAAALAPEQNALSRRKIGLSSLGISKQFIKIHLELLAKTQALDSLAAPLQAAGLPIICQDVPPITLP